MVSLLRQSDYRSVQNLPFCYLCGRQFAGGDAKNRDHVPPECVFLPRDREPLWLPTHIACNSGYRLVDEKIGQLIALRYRKVPRNAALYRKSGVGIQGSLVTPFPKAQIIGGHPVFAPLLVQHSLFVQTIKSNRLRGNLDRIECNKGKMTYECVWQQADNNGPWMCIFALDIYDWKDLGRTGALPARGCAGFYLTPTRSVPANATKALASGIIVPTSDRLDAFAR